MNMQKQPALRGSNPKAQAAFLLQAKNQEQYVLVSQER